MIYQCLPEDDDNFWIDGYTTTADTSIVQTTTESSTTAETTTTTNGTTGTEWTDIVNSYTPFIDGTASGDPTATPEQLAAINRMNFYRHVSGIPMVELHELVNDAAENHAQYVADNGGAHNETPGLPGFTGESVGDRLDHVGFDWGSYGSWSEDVAFQNDPTASCDQLFGTVYHRSPMLNPDTVLMGYGGATGTNGSADVYDFIIDTNASNSIAVYPIDGQEGVPTRFASDSEGPDPIPDKNLVGYPISVHFGSSAGSVSSATSSLKDSTDTDVAHYLLWTNTDSNGYLDSDVFLLAEEPLTASSSYTVSIEATCGDRYFNETWSFTTGEDSSTKKLPKVM